MPDLFGNEDRLATIDAKGIAVSLFDHAADHIANDSGRARSQVMTELVFGAAHAIQACERCDARFVASPRSPALCNLCRAGYTFCRTCGIQAPKHSAACPHGAA